MTAGRAALTEGLNPWETALFYFFANPVMTRLDVRASAKFPVSGTVVHDAFVLLAYSYMNLCKSHKRQGGNGEFIEAYRSEGGLPGRLQ
ncbi:hypothetical protein PAGL106935_23810 [Paenibacillus glucanolyticus]|jgi:hypothetical protein